MKAPKRQPKPKPIRGCYLIHFAEPYKHARHYLGWADDIGRRLRQHRAGTGARLMEVVTEAGIDWQCVRVWRGATLWEERLLKRRHNGGAFCPVCRGKLATPPDFEFFLI